MSPVIQFPNRKDFAEAHTLADALENARLDAEIVALDERRGAPRIRLIPFVGAHVLVTVFGAVQASIKRVENDRRRFNPGGLYRCNEVGTFLDQIERDRHEIKGMPSASSARCLCLKASALA